MNRKSLFNLLKIIISLGLILFILSRIDLTKVGEVLRQANPFWLTIAVIVALVNVVARATRWQVLLKTIQVAVPLQALVSIYFIGAAFNNLLPSGVGGDAIRAVELNRYTNRVSDAVTSVVVDRFLGLYGSLLLGFTTLMFAWQQVPWQVTLASVVCFLGMTVVGFILISEPLYRQLCRLPFIRQITGIRLVSGLFESFQGYSLRAIGQAFVVGLLVNILLIVMNVTIGFALDLNVELIYYLIFVPLVNLTLALPISFAGFGAREVVYISLFANVGVLEEQAFTLSLLVYVVGNIGPGLIGGILYLWRSTTGLNSTKNQKTKEQKVGKL